MTISTIRITTDNAKVNPTINGNTAASNFNMTTATFLVRDLPEWELINY